jgi:hypothetical protein
MRYYDTCERLFQDGGPFYHVCTKGAETDIYFRNEEEMNLALNVIALAVFATGCRLLAFAVMSNHFHFVIEGPVEVCVSFFEEFKSRLCKVLPSASAREEARKCTVSYIRIEDLAQLRAEIAYVIRNPFVANRNVNMFSYPWCSGYLCFNGTRSLMREGEQLCKKSIDYRRSFMRSRSAEVNPEIVLLDGVAMPSCFVDYRRTESFFEDARDFQHCLLKNVESQVVIAKRIGETVSLDDYELRSVMFQKCNTDYRVSSPKELNNADFVMLAKTLKYEYGASNAQLARILNKPSYLIDQIFPLSAKTK